MPRREDILAQATPPSAPSPALLPPTPGPPNPLPPTPLSPASLPPALPASAAFRLKQVLAGLSPSLTLASVAIFAAGVATGGVVYLRRSPVREVESAGTAAWWPHLALFAVAVTLLVTARLRLRRRQRRRELETGREAGARGRKLPGEPRPSYQPVDLLLLAPFGKPAARRIAMTLRMARRSPGALARLVAAAVGAIPLAYSLFRSGIQVIAGLDPNFTINAWGGPTYLGAMACHYLDGALIVAAAALLVSRILLPDPERPQHIGRARRRGRS